MHAIAPLARAAWRGDVDEVRSLLGRGEPVDEVDAYGLTPLMYAAKEQHPAVCRVLLEHGADLHRVPKGRVDAFDGYAPLLLAGMFPATERLLETVSVLLDAGADPDTRHQDGDTSLHCAVAHLQVEVARLLLERGADVEGRADDGETPLTLAARLVPEPEQGERRLAIVRLLLAAGADPRRRGHWGDSAFSLAESRGDQALLAELRGGR